MRLAGRSDIDYSDFVRRKRLAILLALLALMLVASVITSPARTLRTNAALLTGAQIEPSVFAIIQRSCQDCHSEATHYPWYDYIFPASWLVTNDVTGGRKHLNFSHWSEYPLVRRMRSLSEIANQVKDGDMPLFQYTLIHRGARLSPADVDAIFQWTQAERARLIAAGR